MAADEAQGRAPARDTFLLAGYAACQSVTIVFALALAWWLSQPPFNDDAALNQAILASVSAVMATLATIFELRGAAWYKTRFNSSLPALAGGVLLGALYIGACRQQAIALAVIGASGFRLLGVLWQLGPRAAPTPVLAGSAMGYWAFLLSYADGYKTLWIHHAIQSGSVHVDLLFQAAVASMLSNYGIGSLGVEGLSPFPYHFGSHHVMIVLYELLGIPPLQFYSVVFPTIFAPLFICAMYCFAEATRALLDGASTRQASTMAGSNWFWAISGILFVGIIPVATRRELGIWENSFHSESFGIAILFAYVGGIWVLTQLRTRGQVRLTRCTAPILALYLVALCVLKISVGLVFGATVAYALIRNRRSWPEKAGGLVTIGLPLVYCLWLTRSSNEGGAAGPTLVEMIKPFAFLREIVKPEWWGLAFAGFFGPLILLVTLRLLWPAPDALRSLPSRLRNHTLMDVELAIIITIVSVLPGIVLDVPQGSTNFFAEVSWWWVQPALAAVLTRHLVHFASRQNGTNH